MGNDLIDMFFELTKKYAKQLIIDVAQGLSNQTSSAKDAPVVDDDAVASKAIDDLANLLKKGFGLVDEEPKNPSSISKVASGLSKFQEDVLLILQDQKDSKRLYAKGIAKRLESDLSLVTKTLNGLEKKGFVESQTNAAGKSFAITQEGKKLLNVSQSLSADKEEPVSQEKSDKVLRMLWNMQEKDIMFCAYFSEIQERFNYDSAIKINKKELTTVLDSLIYDGLVSIMPENKNMYCLTSTGKTHARDLCLEFKKNLPSQGHAPSPKEQEVTTLPENFVFNFKPVFFFENKEDSQKNKTFSARMLELFRQAAVALGKPENTLLLSAQDVNKHLKIKTRTAAIKLVQNCKKNGLDLIGKKHVDGNRKHIAYFLNGEALKLLENYKKRQEEKCFYDRNNQPIDAKSPEGIIHALFQQQAREMSLNKIILKNAMLAKAFGTEAPISTRITKLLNKLNPAPFERQGRKGLVLTSYGIDVQKSRYAPKP